MSRQFLLLCDDEGMAALKTVFQDKTIQFLEIQGLNLNNENKLNLLVTPVIPPVNPAQVAQPPLPPPELAPTMDAAPNA